MFEASHLQYRIVSGLIQVVSDGHYLPAFWSHPELGGPFPGLVLLHDEWGMTAHVRSQARRFAELGYYVIAPDLYGGRTASTAEQARDLAAEVNVTAVARVNAVLHALKTHHRCSGQIGLVGWGIGARLALNTAIFRDDLRVVVLFYGLPDDLSPAELRMMVCPLLGLFAEQDSSIDRGRIDLLRQTLDQTGLDHEIVLYPDVGRGFFDDSRPTFHPVAAEDAWQRALAFLSAHLDVPRPRPDEFFPGRVY